MLLEENREGRKLNNVCLSFLFLFFFIQLLDEPVRPVHTNEYTTRSVHQSQLLLQLAQRDQQKTHFLHRHYIMKNLVVWTRKRRPRRTSTFFFPPQYK